MHRIRKQLTAIVEIAKFKEEIKKVIAKLLTC